MIDHDGACLRIVRLRHHEAIQSIDGVCLVGVPPLTHVLSHVAMTDTEFGVEVVVTDLTRGCHVLGVAKRAPAGAVAGGLQEI